MAHYRRGSMFVRDLREHSTPLDRNQAARILFLAERLDIKSKAKGARNGALGLTGLAVLRALLLRFQNRQNGLCMPSYTALQKATGLCRQTVARALSRLADAGIVAWTRRIVRENVGGIVVTRQSSNVYRMQEPSGEPRQASARSRPFPTRGPLAALAAMALRRAESTGKAVTIDQDHTGRVFGWDRGIDWHARAVMTMQLKARKGPVKGPVVGPVVGCPKHL